MGNKIFGFQAMKDFATSATGNEPRQSAIYRFVRPRLRRQIKSYQVQQDGCQELKKKEDFVFERSLEEFVDVEGVHIFVRWSVEAICRTGAGLKTDAIYRASGSRDVIAHIAKQTKTSMHEVLLKQKNIHDLTGALKLFFRNLKKPILCIEDFQNVLKDDDEDCKIQDSFKDIINQKLLKEQRATLSFLLSHLRSVLDYPSNNMKLEGMGVVFGPVLMRHNNDVTQIEAELKKMIRVVVLLLQHYLHIFSTAPPPPNQAAPTKT